MFVFSLVDLVSVDICIFNLKLNRTLCSVIEQPRGSKLKRDQCYLPSWVDAQVFICVSRVYSHRSNIINSEISFHRCNVGLTVWPFANSCHNNLAVKVPVLACQHSDLSATPLILNRYNNKIRVTIIRVIIISDVSHSTLGLGADNVD